MIITTIEGNIAVYCNGSTYILQDERQVSKTLLEEIQNKIGAPVKSVYKEIQCDNIHVIVESNKLTIIGVHKYTLNLDLLYANYVFPDKILACFRGHCWTCSLGNNLHIMKLEYRWYEHIVNGRKTVEGRLYDEKRRKIGVGDCIVFKPVGCSRCNTLLYAVVLGLRRYSSFRELLEREGIEHVLPDIRSLDEGVRVYREYYSVEDEERYGVVAIELGLL